MSINNLHNIPYRKGDSISLASEVTLSHIDFLAIAEKSNLQLSPWMYQAIKEILKTYASQISAWESMPTARAKKAFIKKVLKACELLESIFEFDAYGSVGEFDKMRYASWLTIMPSVECFLEELPGSKVQQLVVKESRPFKGVVNKQIPLDGKNVADYLSMCRGKINDELKFPNKSGNPRKIAIKRCVEGLHKIYTRAGGKGRGSWEYEGRKREMRGPFLDFAYSLLECTDYPYDKKKLGNQIKKIIK